MEEGADSCLLVSYPSVAKASVRVAEASVRPCDITTYDSYNNKLWAIGDLRLVLQSKTGNFE